MAKVKYTLTITQSEDPENWETSNTEDMLEAIKKYILEDPEYLTIGVSKIEVVLIP